MNVTTDMLMAYVDGELPPDEMRRIEAEIAARPELRNWVDQQRALAGALHAAFGEIIDAPVPASLTAAAAKPPSRRWRLREALRAVKARRLILATGIPAAAALASGLVIGVMLRGPAGGEIAPADGTLVARGALAEALNTQLAAESPQTARVRIGISFRDKENHYCRTFRTDRQAGVACRENDAWAVAALARTAPEDGANAAYRPAGSAMPDAVRAAVQTLIAGAPLDAAGERNARARNWAPR